MALHHGVPVDVYTLTERLHTDLQGTSFDSLQEVAQELGFETAMGIVKPDCLDRIPLPAIAHFREQHRQHIVVIHRVTAKRVLIADPAVGLDKLTRAAFLTRWSGYALLLRPKSSLEVAKVPRVRSTQSALKHLATTLARHRALLLIAFVAALAIAGIAFSIARFTQFVVDSASGAMPIDEFWRGTSVVVGLVTIRAALTVIREAVLNRVGYLLEYELSTNVAQKLLKLPVRFFETRTVGDIYECVNNAAVIRATALGACFTASLDLILLGLGATLLALKDITLTAMVLAILPLIVAIGWAGGTPLATLDRKMREATARHASFFLEMSLSAKILKMYNAEAKAVGDVRSSLLDLLQIKRKRYDTFGVMEASVGLMAAIILIAALVQGRMLTTHGAISIGQLMLFYSLITIIITSAQRLAPSLGAINDTLIGVERLQAIARQTPERSGTAVSAEESSANILTLREVSFQWRAMDPVLCNISFQLRKDETVAIIGETGSGKSTLAAIIGGLYEASAGDVIFGGRPIASWDKRALRGSMAFVFQEAGIVPGSILENIALGKPEADMDAVWEAARLACADAFIKRKPRGLEYQVGPGGIALSSGQRQRVAIARALLWDPPLLILDEATGNLDVETEEAVLNNILGRRGGRATIVITHKLNMMARFDRVMVLHAGRIIEDGSYEELRRKGGRFCELLRAGVTTA